MTSIDAATESTDELVRRCLPLAHAVVADIASRVPRHVARDDLRSAGLFGLVQAANSWDPDRGVAFEAYARSRIHGAVLDELRSRDWASRSARANARRHQEAVMTLVNTTGRMPTTADIAGHLDVDVDAIHAIERDTARASVHSLDAVVDAGADVALAGDDPGEVLVDSELKDVLRSAISALPDRLRKVVVDYFFAERPMQDIADELGVTESRISQMRAEALTLLRDGMNTQLEPELVPDLGHMFGRVNRRKNDYYGAVAAAEDARLRPFANTA